MTYSNYVLSLSTNKGAPFTVINNYGFYHLGTVDHPIMSLWLSTVLSQRLPAELPTEGPVDLPSWNGAEGWVGSYDVVSYGQGIKQIFDPRSVRLDRVEVSPKDENRAPRPFTWLPSRNTAYEWKKYEEIGTASP